MVDVRYGRFASDDIADWYLEASRGRIGGIETIHKFGFATNIDTADGVVDIWDGVNGNLPSKINPYNWIDGPVDIQVSSTSAADVGIEISGEGLDENWLKQSGSATLNGQTPVNVGFQRNRIHRAYTSGPVAAQGIVYVSELGTPTTGGVPDDLSKVYMIMHPESQQTQMAVYTVPIDSNLYITHGWANLSKASTTEAVVQIFQREQGGVFRNLHTLSLSTAGSSGDHRPYIVPLKIKGGTDLVYRAQVFSNNSAVSAGFHGLLIKD